MRSSLRIVGGCCLAMLALIACTYRAYDGPPLSPAERATVDGETHFYVFAAEGIEITSVDGKRKPVFADGVEVKPGYHSLSANYLAQYGYFGEHGIRDCVIEFEAVAGHDYLVEYESGSGRWSAWLRDTTTDQRIADCSWIAAPVYSWTPRPIPTPTPLGA